MVKCPLCGGRKVDGKTTFTVDFGEGFVVVRNVPATICEQCGEEWLDDRTAKKLEKITTTARENHTELEMIPYEKIAS